MRLPLAQLKTFRNRQVTPASHTQERRNYQQQAKRLERVSVGKDLRDLVSAPMILRREAIRLKRRNTRKHRINRSTSAPGKSVNTCWYTWTNARMYATHACTQSSVNTRICLQVRSRTKGEGQGWGDTESSDQ
jgi:hypothetical protein